MLYKRISEMSREEKDRLIRRGGELADVRDTVASILQDVRQNGDAALRLYTGKFDGAELGAIEVSEQEMDEAMQSIDASLLKHLEFAAGNIRKFHQAQMPEKVWFMELSPGIELGQKFTPLESVGAYVPGGRASYPSTALMTIIPAKVAGVRNVVMCTPPGADGRINPLTLAAARIAGADHVYKVGGVQAIGAMAYGTETVLSVCKIVGPGNVYVTAAKMQVRDKAEIDFPAGPSEVLIIADDSADARMAASDIIAQAEHDPNAVSVLVTTSAQLAEDVHAEVLGQAARTARAEIVRSSLANAAVILAGSLEECIGFSNDFAPEHLEIMVSEPDYVLERIENAGSIFVGNYAPVPVGDYASGTNHVLPTAGYAKIYSGLNISHFMKSASIQRISKQGLETLKDAVISIAEKEGLTGHADSIRTRFSN
ncbi:histidinol dehydrogenase [Methanolobus chelungpuianus]|uniref:Histidinol dehydrogenase n=1 Tax=Methanolobus chelungpuianus TaxID=502115 RepID=A0AAE3HAN6_9EURY|nr:histidinol dehydrogenase [Methanolobus chelungpuianus]MCQ6962851.1 histidinol dehydrogenase [Methanolobus chelungpuianus]